VDEGDRANLASPSVEQGASAGIERGASCDDIVDEEDHATFGTHGISAEGASDDARTLLAAHRLRERLRGANTTSGLRVAGEAHVPGEVAREQRGLVVAARALASAMEGHRDHEIGGQRPGGRDHKAGHRAGEGDEALVLEQVDKVARGVGVDVRGTNGNKGGRRGSTGRATRTRADVIPATHAPGRLGEGQERDAKVAEDRPAGSAHGTLWWEEQVESDAGRTLEDGGHCPASIRRDGADGSAS